MGIDSAVNVQPPATMTRKQASEALAHFFQFTKFLV
jgi:hypothetical protein